MRKNGKFFVGFTASIGIIIMLWRRLYRKYLNKVSMSNEYGNKMKRFYSLLIEWMKLKQEGRNLAEYFYDRGYKSIAIYGMKELGKLLLEELKESNVTVRYAIDRMADSLKNEDTIEIKGLNGRFEGIDVVVVTAIQYFNEIEQDISGMTDAEIISLEDAVYGMEYIHF